jgi:filamentous hemagglutinin family protein
MLPSTYREFRLFYRKVVAYAAIAALTITPAVSFSVPQGGSITIGSGDIRVDGNTLTINQLSPKAVIDWQEFNIGESEGTVFKQPDGGIALNRIHDINPSQIDGKLTANGQVMLINPNGMVFGKNSKVDVGGMVATTADITNEDFMAGKNRFGKAGNPNARIVNQGTITAKPGGGIALVAPGVANRGTINANLGKVQLGGADTLTLDMQGDGLIVYDVTDSLKDQFVDHSGKINAQGGIVTLTTAAADSVIDSSINISGNIDVSNAAGEGGVVIAQAGSHRANGKNGTVLVSGKINASGDKGGAIHILGDQIGLDAGSKLDATGTRGGGEVLVGGDYLGGKYTGTVQPNREKAGGNSAVQAGKNGKLLEQYHTKRGGIQKARKVYMDKDASIDVSAKDAGNGGRAILWSDEQTKFYGNIKANGGNISGNGGFIETSSKEILTAIGTADASATKGNSGTWLLDPNNIFVVTGVDGANTNILTTAGPPKRFDTTTDGSIVTTGSIEAALNAGTSVTIETGTGAPSTEAGYVVFGNNITKTAGGLATLLVRAADSIVLNAGVQIISNVGALNVIMHSDKDSSGQGLFAMSTGSGIYTNGGNVTIGGGADPTVNAARGSAAAGVNAGIYITGSTIDAQGGNISMIGQGRDVGAGTFLFGVGLVSGTTVKTSGSGNITIKGTGGIGASSNVGLVFDGAGTKVETVDGAIDITGTGSASSADGNGGVAIQNAAVVEQTGTAALTGNVRIRGTGGAGTFSNIGVLIQSAGTRITSKSGDIQIIGDSNGTTNTNHGVWMQTGAIVESTGATSDAANITISGTSGNGVSTNVGFNASNATVRSQKGSIDITGVGRGTGAGSTNPGVYLENGALIQQTDTSATAATVRLRGTGGRGGNNNVGVWMTGAGTRVSSENANISLIGDTNATTNTNHGVELDTGAIVESTGTTSNAATITINGTSAAGATDSQIGTTIAGGTIQSARGDIAITGTSAATGTSSIGVAFTAAGKALSTGTANISIIGSSAGTGNADIYGAGGGNIIGGPSAAGSISISGNRMDVTNTSIQTTGATTLKARTAATQINIDGIGIFAGLNIMDSFLALINTGSLIIGDDVVGSGPMNINTGHTFNRPVQFATGTGLITVTGLPATAGGTGSYRFSGPTSIGIGLNTSASNGAIRFDDPVTLTNDVVFNSGNGNINFGSTINGTTNFTELLTLNSGSGSVTFGDTVGQVVPLEGLNINSTGNVSASSSIDVGAGTATISGANINLTGTLKANTINLSGTSNIAAVINGNTVTITGPNATLTGLVGGANSQSAANSITVTGFPPPSVTRTFNGWFIGNINSSSPFPSSPPASVDPQPTPPVSIINTPPVAPAPTQPAPIVTITPIIPENVVTNFVTETLNEILYLQQDTVETRIRILGSHR